MQRTAVKIKSDNPSHHGFYTQWADAMKPGDVLYEENAHPATENEIKKLEPSINKKRVKR